MSGNASGSEYWGDGAGSSKALSASYVATTSHDVDNAKFLFLTYTIDTSNAGSILIKPQWSPDNSNWSDLPAIDNVYSGVTEVRSLVFDVQTADGSYSTPKIEMPYSYGYVRILAKLGSNAANLYMDGYHEG